MSDAWHTKSTTVKPTASQERYIVLTDAEHTEINQLLSQLKIDDTNNEARRANFWSCIKNSPTQRMKQKSGLLLEQCND